MNHVPRAYMLRPRVAKSSNFSKQREIHILCETCPLQLFAANCTVFFFLNWTKQNVSVSQMQLVILLIGNLRTIQRPCKSS